MINYYDFNDVATVIDATLFKYNYIDNRILTLVKNQLDYRVVNDGSLLVSKEQLSLFLKENFQSDINRINATGFEQFHKEATTVYFLHKILTDFTNLEYVKMTINKNKSYSRLSDIDGVKTLRFNFKVLAGTLRLYDIFKEESLKEINNTLISLGLMQKNVPYARHHASHIFNALDSFVRSNEGSDAKEFEAALDLMDCIEAKIQDDNPKIMLITDY
tara:strand:+ start:1899 stop:2549 length:651 start_codon:yes stop_codon:yes gene_type:complete